MYMYICKIIYLNKYVNMQILMTACPILVKITELVRTWSTIIDVIVCRDSMAKTVKKVSTFNTKFLLSPKEIYHFKNDAMVKNGVC